MQTAASCLHNEIFMNMEDEEYQAGCLIVKAEGDIAPLNAEAQISDGDGLHILNFLAITRGR